MSSSRYVGRHSGPRRSRLSVARAGLTRTAAKSVAGVGIILGCGAFVLAPSSAIGTSTDESSASGTGPAVAAQLLAERSEDETSSRSTERSVSVAAPRAGGDDRAAGSVDLEVVAKPKPKPKAKATPEATSTTAAEAEDTEGEVAEEPSETAEATASEERESAPAEPAQERSEETASRSQERPASPSAGGSPVDTGQYSSQAAGLGLGQNAQEVYSAVRTQFPDMTDIGGYRAGDGGDHGSGRAVDIMVTGARGDEVAAWLQENAGQLNISYVIWKQRIWMPGGSWEPMEDRGDPTQNHFDHVHVSVS